MIPRAHITAWRAQAPWPDDAQVEQDLVLSRALVEIFGSELLAKSLVFRGGTALHKLFFAPPGRYSEDIDLVQIEAGKIGPVLDALRERLDPWLGEPTRKRGEGRSRRSSPFGRPLPLVEPVRGLGGHHPSSLLSPLDDVREDGGRQRRLDADDYEAFPCNAHKIR